MTYLNPVRVQRLRVATGTPQSDLANLLGVPGSTLSRIESGRLEADRNMIVKMARHLRCTPEMLVSTAPDYLHTRPWLRAYADAPKKAVDQYLADAHLAVETIRDLGLQTLPEILPPFNGDVSDELAIDDYALQVREAASVTGAAGVPNVTRAVERLGCVVIPMPHELGRHLGMSGRVDNLPIIRVARPAPDLPGDRQRFTVAHELGHLGLHAGTPPPQSSDEAKEIERQAHRFAAGFLLPGDAYLDDLDSVSKGRVTLAALVTLKGRWGVSVKAQIVRAQQLGRINTDHARSLYKQVSARGWNTSEPERVGNEDAIWFSKALNRKYPVEPLNNAAKKVGLEASWLESWTNWASQIAGEVIHLEDSRRRRRQK